MENLKIIFNPTNKNIEDIEEWGIEKSYLYECFKNKTLIIAEYEDDTIGYYCLREENFFTIIIETAEIKIKYRKKGIGTTIFMKILEEYKKKKYYSFILSCSPSDTQFYWEKFGFKFFPKNEDFCKSNKMMYLIIKDVCSEVFELNHNNIIIIKDDYSTYIWKFNLIKDTNELMFPIVFYGSNECNIELKINGETLYNGRYKYFENHRMDHNYIFIKNIPQKWISKINRINDI